MSAPRPRLIVRNHAPGRRALWWLAGLLIVAAVIAGAFELGRYRAGFDGAAARTERAGFKDKIAALEEELRTARLKLAMFDTESAGQGHERTEFSKTIGELQAEVARLNSDVAFYKGVVEDRSTPEVVKVQQFHVGAGKGEREFVLRLVLGRPLRPEDLITGKARMTIEGSNADGSAASYDLAALGVEGGELSFSLRYVETLEQAVRLPAGFTPSRTTVELAPARKGVNPVRETFLWTVDN
ncbi:MAG: DUF6776 family protein [Pseudomonadota bacterium]